MSAEITPAPEKRQRRRIPVVAFALMLLLAGATSAAWFYWPQAVPQPDAVKKIPRVNRLAFSPGKNAPYLAAVLSDGRVRLWETATSRELPVKLPSQWPLNDLAWSADGNVVYVGGFEEHVLGWNLKTSRPIKLPKFATPVVSIAARPTRAELLVSLSNAELWRVDLQADSREVISSGHQGVVKVVRYHPDGKSFVTAGVDRQLVWHDAETRTVLRSITAHDNEIGSLAFNRDGSELVSGSWDNSAKVWLRDASKPTATLSHPDGVSTVGWHEGHVVTSCWDGHLRVWNVNDAEVTHERPCRADTLVFAVWPGRDQIAEVDADGALHIAAP